MVDRLEELLDMLEAEDDEEREDALELVRAAVPAASAPERETEISPGGRDEDRAPALGEDEGGSARDGELSRIPNVRMPPEEKEQEVPEAGGGAGDSAAEDGAAGNETAELWRAGPAAPVMGQDGPAARRRPGSGDVEPADLAGGARQGSSAETGAAAEPMPAAEKGLEGLYRQTVRAGRPAAQNLSAERAGRTARAEEPGRTAALTVDELDRAVRRDSRRYDGGMTIY